MENSSNLKKRLYQSLLNKSPQQNSILDPGKTTNFASILKPKVNQEIHSSKAKKPHPAFEKGKLKIDSQQEKKFETPKRIIPIQVSGKVSKSGKAVIEEGKLKSKANLKPHDIFAFYEAFPEMIEDFFYLNRVGSSYDYQIVTYSQRNKSEYMTISSKGVTLYHDKEAEFMTKEEWVEDERIYHMLQKIDFFRQYKISKNFLIWKNRMRRHYMKEMSQTLHQSLFLCYQHPRNCLLEVRKITNHLKESLHFMPSDTISSMAPKTFTEHVLSYLNEEFIPKILEIQEMISLSLKEAIDQEIRKFKLENNIKIQEVGDYDKNDHKEGYVYSQEAILRKQYKKVHKLIKLADTMLLESKIELFQKCLIHLVDKVQEAQTEEPKQEWITCTALTDSESRSHQNQVIEWDPSLAGLKEVFQTIITETVLRLSEKHSKLSNRDSFQKYKVSEDIDSRKDDKTNTLKFMIEKSEFYWPLIQRIEKFLEAEFEKTKCQEVELFKFIDIYSRHRSLPSTREAFWEHSASELCQLLREWRQDDADMHLLPENKSTGFLMFNYSELRKKMVLAPSQSISSFLNYLPEESSKRCLDMLHESRAMLEMISAYPKDIESFITFNSAVRLATEKLDGLLEGGKEVVQLVGLMEEHKLANLDLYRTRSKETMAAISSLKLKVDESNAAYDQSLARFKKDLEAKTLHAKTQVADLKRDFELIPFDSISSQIAPTLEKLHAIRPSIQELQEKALFLERIEKELSLPETDFSEIHELFQKSTLINELWECKEKWNRMLLGIFRLHYTAVNCQQIKQEWEGFSQEVSSLLQELSDNEVLKRLNVEIAEFENLVDTVSALTSPNLEEKSWREISEYLAYELNAENQDSLPFENRQDSLYTIEWLISNNISLHKEKISFIVQKSHKEKELHLTLADYKNQLSNIFIDTEVKKREIALVKQNQQLKDNLSHKISTLYSLIGNQYSEALKQEAELLIRHYEYVEEIYEGLQDFRSQWEKYEVFFDTNSVSVKLLSKQSKDFTSWELQWKKITKSIINDSAYFYKKVCDETTGVHCSRAMVKSMNKCNMLLDMVKRGVEEFLEKKRIQFPRYYLYTDQELLKILAKLDSKQFLQPEIVRILYQNIESIEYEEDSGTIVSVISKQKEKLPLIKQSTFKIQSDMEDVLKTTEELIRRTISQNIRSTFSKYTEEEISRSQLFEESQMQVSLCVDYVSWVRLAEETYLVSEPLGTMQDWLDIQGQQIKELSTCLGNSRCDSVERLKLVQAMVQSIYFREKTQSLWKNGVKSTEHYEWERMPKLMITPSEIFLRQAHSKLHYGCELLNHSEVVMILCETERVWLNLVKAISSKTAVGLNGSHSATLSSLAFYVGQSVFDLKISADCNVKTVEKALTGLMSMGCWIKFQEISNSEILTYLCYHLNRKNTIDSSNASTQISKTSAFSSSFSNSVFLFECGQNLQNTDLIRPENYRNVCFVQPNELRMLEILCQAQHVPTTLARKLLDTTSYCREAFELQTTLSSQLLKNTLQHIIKKAGNLSRRDLLDDSEVLEYLAISEVEALLSLEINKDDMELFQLYKATTLPKFNILASKLNCPLKPQSERSFFHSYLQSHSLSKRLPRQFVEQAERLYQFLTRSQKLGIVVCGPSLSGKSKMLNFVEEIYRAELLSLENNSDSMSVSKIYHEAYQHQSLISGLVERKEKKEKNEKSEKDAIAEKCSTEHGIIQRFLSTEQQSKWLIFDGRLTETFTDLINSTSNKLLVPNHGIISGQTHDQDVCQKPKIILQTLSSHQLSPSLCFSVGFVSTNSKTLSTESLVNTFFQKSEIERHLRALSKESKSYMKSQLISILQKVEQKGNLKSKLLQFVHPLTDNEITTKTLKMMECIFRLNSESIQEKEKNMKKSIEKFVLWSVWIVTFLHVSPSNQDKLAKKMIELCKCDHVFSENISRYIVYPGSGIEVHPVNGLRTQSSLFEIPDKGIITYVTDNEVNELFNMGQKNKFYQEICLEDISSIRVNYEQSNAFSYYAQLFAYGNLPIVLYGKEGSGKKSILELHSKNNKNRCFLHSIRPKRDLSLIELFEKPFRKFNSLKGVVLKSHNPNKSIIVSIEDLSLSMSQIEPLEFIRQLANESSYLTKTGLRRSLTDSGNSLTIISNRVEEDDTVIRAANKLMFFQTSQVNSEKLSSVFQPFLKAWSKSCNLQGEQSRLFDSVNGDGLLDATISIYNFMEELCQTKLNKSDYSFENILKKPRIGDISKALAFICKNHSAASLSVAGFSELWANEILRVFGDRIRSSSHEETQNLLQLMKKEFFLKFKENFLYKSKDTLIFSNILTEENQSYEKIEDLDNLQQLVINLIESEMISVPVKLFFDELLLEVMKIYRVIEVENGHIAVLHINKKVRRYLIELACQVAESNFLPMNSEVLSVERDILPTVDLSENVCIFEDLEDITCEQNYQFTCLLNKNYLEFEMKPEVREKLKNRLSKYLKCNLAESSAARQSLTQTVKNQETLKGREANYLNHKIEEDLQNTMRQIFMSNSHFILAADPQSPKSKQFLISETDFVGCLHFNWINIPETSLQSVSKQLLLMEESTEEDEQCEEKLSDKLICQTEDEKQQKQKEANRILDSCTAIYNSQTESQRNFNDLFSICESAKAVKQKLLVSTEQKIKEWGKCIQNIEKAKTIIQENEASLSSIRDQIEEIKKEQTELSKVLEQKANEINELQLNAFTADHENSTQKNPIIAEKNAELESIEDQLRETKKRKDDLQAKSKDCRKLIQISSDFLSVLGSIEEIKSYLQQQLAFKSHLETLVVLWVSLVNFTRNTPIAETMSQLNNWQSLMNISAEMAIEFKTAGDVLSGFKKIFEELEPILSCWSTFSDTLKLRALITLYTLQNQDETSLSNRILSIWDPSGIFKIMFGTIPTNSPHCHFRAEPEITSFNEDFWIDIEPFKNNLILLKPSISLRDKWQIEKAIEQRRDVQMSRFVYLSSNREETDVAFGLTQEEIKHLLKIGIFKQQNSAKAHENGLRQSQLDLQNQKFKEKLKLFRQKSSEVEFRYEDDTEELRKVSQSLSLLNKSIREQKTQDFASFTIEEIPDLIVNLIVQKFFQHERTLSIAEFQKLISIIRQHVQNKTLQIKGSEKDLVCEDEDTKEPLTELADKDTVKGENTETSALEDEYLKIKETIESIISVHLSQTITVSQQDPKVMLEVKLLSLPVNQKIPIVVLPHSFSLSSTIGKELKPSNLLINGCFSNQLTDNCDQDIVRKSFIFYNDKTHHASLMELVARYLADWKADPKKEYCIFLLTNCPLDRLSHSASDYQLFSCQSVESQREHESEANGLNQTDSSEEEFRIEFYRKMNSLICRTTLPQFDREEKSSIQKLSTEEKIQYLLDSTHPLSKEKEMLRKLFSDQQISRSEAAQVIQQLYKTSRSAELKEQKLSQNQSFCKKITEINIEDIESIEEELPNVFNSAEFIESSQKDAFCASVEKMAKLYNKKIKRITHQCRSLRQEYCLRVGKIELDRTFEIPSFEKVKALNVEYKSLKKILGYLGMISAVQPSMSKIASSKGLSSNKDMPFEKTCIPYQELSVSPKTITDFKLRVSRKLKIPYEQVALKWQVLKKESSQIMQNAVSELTLCLSGKMMHCHSIQPTESLANSHKLLSSGRNKNAVRLLLIGCDESQTADSSTAPLSAKKDTIIIKRDPRAVNKKDTIAINKKEPAVKNKKQTTTISKKEEATREKVDLITIPIYVPKENREICLGQAQLPINQVSCKNLPFLQPRIVLSQNIIN